ncbi:MAG TPA: acyl-CoA dehydrogenase [Acidimicrobiales bacterium]|nr:acyl-CoA dehydrogenase [Acidimicrobiales bacterium]
MSIAISPEHVELSRAVRRFLENRCPPAVARAGLDEDAGTEALPAFWAEWAGLGWLGLHLPEKYGGGGFGLAEVAVVLEELGRAGAPGPFLPSMAAAGLIALGASPALSASLLPSLASGEAAGAVAFPANGALQASEEPDPDGVLRVSGTLRPVMGGGLAGWLVAPVNTASARIWCAIPAQSLQRVELPSLDLTRRGAEMTADGARVAPDAQLLGLSDAAVRAYLAVLVAAEAAGGAGWCVDTAADWARVRQQFGRPIGQFQGVKHRCADMLVATESARATAWEAAGAMDRALADGALRAGGGAEARLSADIAGAVAPESFFRVAKDCIQVLGGIGFTWEHDAHRYLRRATSLRALMGGPTPWRARAAAAAVDGVRRHLSLDLPPGAEQFREEVRAEAEAIAGRPRPERRGRLVEKGYLVPHWPAPWGIGAGAAEQLVIEEELARVHIRRPGLNIGAWAAPTIVVHGTAEQQERWVRPTLMGEINWCQLFSEPGAGSDLAALSTRAEPAEGGWLISGQKVWTSMAAEADWGMLLARTDPDADRHAGITWFALDMKTPGIDIRPLREMTGLALFNEIFLDDVFVPDDCVVGGVNRGWGLARTTLANERVAMGSGASFGGGLEGLLALVAGQVSAGADHRAADAPRRGIDPVTADAVGALVAEAHTVAVLGQRSASRALGGAEPGPEASVRKLLSAEHDQRTQELGLSLLGADGAATDGTGAQWSYGFLANRCLTIAGGTSEIQRNVIAERLLGLPRDPEPPAARTPSGYGPG